MADIKNRAVDELQKELRDKRESLRAFRFGGAGSRSRNVKEGRTIRKEIARLMTELRARQLATSKKKA